MKEVFKKWLIIAAGSATWAITMIKSGLPGKYGIGFWGANGHDGVWHIALSQSLSRGSLEMPVFSGAMLQNYHIGYDLLLALTHKMTLLPIVNLYFQIFPVIFALLVGHLTYLFVFTWTKSKASALWSTFFVYFAGSFGYLIGRGESAFWSQQSISTLINPPFALSLIVVLLGLIFLLRKKPFWAAVCFGILIEIKAYAGILALGGFFVLAIYEFVKNKRKDYFLLFAGSAVLSLILYTPLNKYSTGLLVWQPFWFLETMMGLTDRIGWIKFYSAMTAYKSGQDLFKEVLAYGAAFTIFLIGNFGTRVIFFFRKMKIDGVAIFIYSMIAAGVVIPTLFLQKGTPWNTIQFFYYSLFFLAILSGIAAVSMNKFIKVIIILLTIPTTILALKDVYIPSRPPAALPKDEISALKFLSEQPQGIVLTYPFDPIKSKEAETISPRPLYLYTSTAYVSAFSSQSTFL